MKKKTGNGQFIDLVLENQNIIHKICGVYCYNHQDRQDLYQEIVLQIYKSFDRFRGESSFSTWMYRIALNTAITQRRKRNRLEQLHDFTDLDLLQANMEPNLDEEVKLLYLSIQKLKKTDRAIILLWLEEKSYQDISDITGLTVKNISVKLVRIKRELTEIINKLQ